MRNPFTSRKFLVAVGTIVSIMLSEYYGMDIDPKVVGGMVFAAAAYIAGEAAVDWKAVKERIVLMLGEELELPEEEE